MGVDYSSFVLLPNFDFWSRPVTFYPAAGGTVIIARGIFDSRAIEYPADDGVIVSDQQTILDIRDAEFAVLPRQGDQVFIGPDNFGGMQDTPGMFEIIDSSNNGGGETTLVLRKIETATP
jgi:hypothetical protein